MNPFVSIIIPTHNRREQIIRCLNVLNSQSYNTDNFEVIVIADSCSDNTEDEIRKFGISSKFKIKILNHESGRASVSRNRGIKEAAGEIIIFMDDDVLPGELFIEKHVEGQKNADVVIGYLETVLPDKPDLWHLLARLWWESRFDDMDMPGHIFNYTDFFTGNVSVKASFLRSAGIFNESFTRLEDYELGYRLINCQARFIFSREAKGKHFETNNLDKWTERQADEGDVFVRFGNLYPELRSSIFNNPDRPEIFKRLTFNKIIPAGLFVLLLLFLCRIFEKLKARKLWQISAGVAGQLNFWRGVNRNFKNIRDFEKWISGSPGVINLSHDAFSIDFKSDQIENLNNDDLEIINKKGLRIKYDDIDLFTYEISPGYEKIRTEHISSLDKQIINKYDFISAVPDYISSWENLLRIRSEHPVKMYDLDITKPITSVTVEEKYKFLVINLFLSDILFGNLVFKCHSRKNFSGEIIYRELQRTCKDQIRQFVLTRDIELLSVHERKHPSVSIVICVEGSCENLVKCLQSVKDVDYSGYEVLIYDCSYNSDQVYEKVKDYDFSYKKIIGKKEEAWSIAAEETVNDVIIFIDENSIVPKNWLSEVAEEFNDRETFSVSGLVLPYELENETHLDHEFYNGSAKVHSPFSLSLKNIKSCKDFYTSALEEKNIAFRTEYLRRISALQSADTSLNNSGDFADAEEYSFRYKPSAFIRYCYGNKRKELIKQVKNQRKSFLYNFLVIGNFISYSYHNKFVVALFFWLINFIMKRIMKSIITLNLRLLFYVLLEIAGFIGFYMRYRKLKAAGDISYFNDL